MSSVIFRLLSIITWATTKVIYEIQTNCSLQLLLFTHMFYFNGVKQVRIILDFECSLCWWIATNVGFGCQLGCTLIVYVKSGFIYSLVWIQYIVITWFLSLLKSYLALFYWNINFQLRYQFVTNISLKNIKYYIHIL